MAKWKTGGFPYRSFEKERNEALDLLDEVNTNAPHARIRALLDRLREEEVHTCACGARVKAPSPGYWVQFCPTCSPALKKTVRERVDAAFKTFGFAENEGIEVVRILADAIDELKK